MKLSLKNLLCLFVLLLSTSCISKKNSKLRTNNQFNEKYKESVKSFTGTLDATQYKEIRALFEKELNTTLPQDKNILINYSQKAENCISPEINKRKKSIQIDNKIKISQSISAQNNTIDFFVYTEDNFDKEKVNFILDSGFFYNKVFTLHENCAAFFILKSNGDFMKFYGEDYYSQVIYFLKKK
ncbi:hypothetical protein MW871_05575 [Flavobacterium sp. I-SCBP12n]|uniref:Uncharacterized protein n=1 Tax=Flavobacterium pygoscelis TaxID=2893176 RepID=A0A9X1XTJ0_9FLAO|nr:hypothetical protein [Flavobacterium pygoscelis]MCK8141358.1 hypothetical protein [Flavobacterium pygoscelis]